MADDERKLSYDELLAILKESTALEARRGPAAFSKKDLLDAAKQLGIDQTAAEQVAEAHLARRAAADVVPRPFDTRVELAVASDTLSLTVPPLRPGAQTLGQLGFATFWLGFVAFWTWGAAHASVGFSLFSLPFWAAGIGIMTRTVLPLLQRTRLTLTRDAGELTVTPLGKRRVLRPSELRVSLGENVRHRQSESSTETPARQAVLLEHGVETFALLDGFSPQEQRWIEGELKAWLANT
jgi:hypothetical protein